MAEIIPQGKIILFRDVPLSPDYNNTFWFYTQTLQALHFQNNYQSVTFENQSYQRKNRGWVRLKAPYKDVFNTNYMMFRNNYATNSTGETVRNQYEQKWWYAFVDTVEYVNDNVSDIHYTIDVIQSYMFDIQYEYTMVERLTVADDTAGANMVDEGLPVGDYVFVNAGAMKFNVSDTGQEYYSLNGLVPIVAATCDEEYKDSTDGAAITTEDGRGMVNGCRMIDVRNIPGRPYVSQWLNDLPGEKHDAILAIQMTPEIIADKKSVTGSFESESINIPTTLGTYNPFNKKLLTYPFNSLYIVNSDGASQIYDYFLFDKLKGRAFFYLTYVYTFPIQGVLRPFGYKGNIDARPTYLMPLPTIPTCTWSNDTWKAWAAMNSGYVANSIAANAADAVMRIGSSFNPYMYMGATLLGSVAYAGYSGGFGQSFNLPSGNPLLSSGSNSLPSSSLSSQVPQYQITSGYGLELDRNALNRNTPGLVNDLLNISNTLISVHNAKIVPDSFNGSASGLAIVASSSYGFFMAQRCIRSDYAQQIDNYFTMFGYKVLTIKQLHHDLLHLRSRFTYIKTANMDIRGNIPADDRSQICSIFDKGVRFWCEYTDVGNYDMTSKPNNPI